MPLTAPKRSNTQKPETGRSQVWGWPGQFSRLCFRIENQKNWWCSSGVESSWVQSLVLDFLLKRYNSMGFCILTTLGHYHHCQCPEHSTSPKETQSPLVVSRHSSPSSPWQPLIFSVSKDLPSLNTSYKWSCMCLCGSYLSSLRIFARVMHVAACTCPFCGWIIFHCTSISHFVYSVDGYLGCFHLLAVINNAVKNMYKRFCGHTFFQFF